MVTDCVEDALRTILLMYVDTTYYYILTSLETKLHHDFEDNRSKCYEHSTYTTLFVTVYVPVATTR